MNVNAAYPNTIGAVHRGPNSSRPNSPEATSKTNSQQTRISNVPGNTSDPQVMAVEAPADQDAETKGVLRRLAEGHFSPVADVRLRINFYDELAQQSEAAAVGQVSDLKDTFVADLSSVVGGMDESEEQPTIDALTDAVAALELELSAGQSNNPDMLELAEQAVADFMDQVASIVTPLQPDVSDEEAVDNPVPTESTLLSAFADLTADYLENLSELLAEAQVSLQIEPVEGVPGKAYEKFMAIYSGLTNPQEPAAETGTTASTLDTSA